MNKNHTALKWTQSLLPLGATLQQAINNLEETCLQIVLVVDENKFLKGTLTDGDIRRGFLNGLTLQSRVDDVMNKKPIVSSPDVKRHLALKSMQVNQVNQLPIIDNTGKTIGLHLRDYSEISDKIDNLMIIMAGGQGKRLYPLTQNCPKPMLKIDDRPILEHIIQKSKTLGFYNFIISVHYLGDVIKDYFNDGKNFGVKINYIQEDKPLGTAGCLSLLNFRPKQPFVVINGDIVADVNCSEILSFHEKNQAKATMAVKTYEMQNPFGVVKTNGIEITGFEEKPIYRSNTNAGIYILDPQVIDYLEYNARCDMPTLFDRIKNNLGKTIAYPIHQNWIDIGRLSDFEQAKKI